MKTTLTIKTGTALTAPPRCRARWVPLAALLWTAGVLAEAPVTGPVTDAHFALTPGYLAPEELPSRLAMLGAPPAPGSAALARDEEARNTALALRGTAREKRATRDADLAFPAPAQAFSCALGVNITVQHTPHLYTLMQRTLSDTGLSTYVGKNSFNRARPFVVHGAGTCTPDMEPVLRHDGSWPSGHAAAGWAWGLVLAEIQPARATALLARGLAFGQSRVICDAHWQSDVDAGRIMGAATVARLHANADFLADLAAARREVATAERSGQLTDEQACVAERAALFLR